MYKQLLSKGLLTSLALGAVLFTSCSNDNDTPDNNDPVAVRFTSAISEATPISMTRAAGAAWANGDKVGVFMVATGTTNIAESADNKQFSTTGTNTFAAVASNEIYFPMSGNSVDFIGYYPYVIGQTLSATYPVNVATQTSQAAIDLLYSKNATAKNKTNPNVALQFDHKLSKVIITTAAGSGLTATDLATMSVKIKGMNVASTFDLKTGTLGASNTTADITAVTASAGSKYEAIVLPATFAAGALTMEFALNNATSDLFTRVNTESEDFQGGKVYNYAVRIDRTGVSITCTITDWTSVPRTGVAN